MKRICILFIIIFFNVVSYSQLRQLLVLNEGAYDYTNNQILVPVTVGSFNPITGLYEKKNEIPDARFASDIVIDGNSYWVAADKYIIQYDLSNHKKLSEHSVEGVRKIAFYNNLIIVTRGEYLKTFSSYIQIYDKTSFSLLFEIPFSDLPYTTESVIVNHNIAYVAVNNGFDFGNEVGKIVKIDLDILKAIETIDMGADGKNPENLMFKGDQLISLNNKDYKGSSVSLIESSNSSVASYNLSNVNSLCGTSTLVGDVVIYQESGKTDLGSFDIHSKQSSFLKNLGKTFYGMYFDQVSQFLCAAETDFRTTGKVYVYDKDFNEIYTFNAGVTPGYFAFDNNSPLSSNQLGINEVVIYPNPANDFLLIQNGATIDELKVMDCTGRQLIKQDGRLIKLNEINAGTYLLQVKSGSKLSYQPFIKTGN